jgi:Mrp family chromosome partitioning ATPase
MTRVLHELRQDADFIIIDSPPMSTVTDASILASRVDGTLIVVEAGRTRSDALGRVIHGLGLAKVRVIGVVLNKVKSGRSNYGFYGYHEAPLDAISEAAGKPLSGATQQGA